MTGMLNLLCCKRSEYNISQVILKVLILAIKKYIKRLCNQVEPLGEASRHGKGGHTLLGSEPGDANCSHPVVGNYPAIIWPDYRPYRLQTRAKTRIQCKAYTRVSLLKRIHGIRRQQHFDWIGLSLSNAFFKWITWGEPFWLFVLRGNDKFDGWMLLFYASWQQIPQSASNQRMPKEKRL